MNFFCFKAVIMAVCCLMLSCSQSSKIESAAKKQMEVTFKEVTKDPSSVKLSNMETVFNDDSLCIIHVDLSAKNGIGVDVKRRYEYIFISSYGKNYESWQEINNDNGGVFVSLGQYDKDKKGKIYESLSYESGLRYLAVIYVNANGREAGVVDGGYFSIPVPTGTGEWETTSCIDEFGEIGEEKYLLLRGHGVFSNSATTSSEMTAIFIIDKNYRFIFKLVEYNSILVKSDKFYEYRIKDSTGDIYDMTLYNSCEHGEMGSDLQTYKEYMKKILSKGGVITVSVKEKYPYSTPDTYLFKLDVIGFEKALSYIKD